VLRAARGPVSVAVAVTFGRAISEVGASLMVRGSIAGLTRMLTTATVLEAGRGSPGHCAGHHPASTRLPRQHGPHLEPAAGRSPIRRGA